MRNRPIDVDFEVVKCESPSDRDILSCLSVGGKVELVDGSGCMIEYECGRFGCLDMGSCPSSSDDSLETTLDCLNIPS